MEGRVVGRVVGQMENVRMVQIREVTESEVAQAREIFAEYMQSIRHLAACSFEHQKTDEELATLPGKYGPPAGAIFLAWDGERCIGCAALRPLPLAGNCELKRMYVKEAYRGKQIGRRLCDAILKKAREIGYLEMKLDSDPELQAAISLYRSLGFKDIARYNQDPDPHTVFMGLRLRD